MKSFQYSQHSWNKANNCNSVILAIISIILTFFSRAKSVDLSNSQQRPHRAVRVEEVSKADGEEMLRKSGGFITKDDDYASDFMAVYPMNAFPAADSHLSVDLKLKKDMDPEYVTVYHSPDMKAWYPVENQDIQDGKARIKLESGKILQTIPHKVYQFLFHAVQDSNMLQLMATKNKTA